MQNPFLYGENRPRRGSSIASPSGRPVTDLAAARRCSSYAPPLRKSSLGGRRWGAVRQNALTASDGPHYSSYLSFLEGYAVPGCAGHQVVVPRACSAAAAVHPPSCVPSRKMGSAILGGLSAVAVRALRDRPPTSLRPARSTADARKRNVVWRSTSSRPSRFNGGTWARAGARPPSIAPRRYASRVGAEPD